jgi:hypothetical protein
MEMADLVAMIDAREASLVSEKRQAMFGGGRISRLIQTATRQEFAHATHHS